MGPFRFTNNKLLPGCASSIRIKSALTLDRLPSVVAVDESIWKMTHAVDDPSERVVVLMPRKPAGMGALTYILAVKLLYSELPFMLVALVRHSARNDMTPLEFLQSLILKLRQVCTVHTNFTLNVIVDSAFWAIRIELSDITIIDRSSLLSVTAIVRNDNDLVMNVLIEGFLRDEYRTFARFNHSPNTFE